MTATVRRRNPPVPGEELVERSSYLGREDAVVLREDVRAAAAELMGAAAAEARAVGAQVRCIHRLWLAAQRARTVARYEEMARLEAAAAAHRAVRPYPLGPLDEPEHQLILDVAAEVGPALRLPAGTACRRVEDAVLLAGTLPDVLAALETGRIGWAQATVLVEQWRELIVEVPESTVPGGRSVPPPVEAVHRLIDGLLERAPHSTASQLRAAARSRRAVLVAQAEERARRHARKSRGVWVEPAPDGMAYLHALLDAHVAITAHSRLEDLAALMGENVPPSELTCFPDLDAPEHTEERSAGELRADVLADLLLEGVLADEPRFPRSVRARVNVTVPVAVLAGRAAEAEAVHCGAPLLSGYGPISSEVARQLAAGAGSWHRLLTHPVTGVVLDHDRTVYAVPADLRRLVELRDGTCRFPGCRRRAEKCELDHTVAWAEGGTTAEGNLAALCKAHHRIKHRVGHLGRWTVRRVDGPGGGTPGATGAGLGVGAVLEWTSPGGLVHRTLPEHQPPRPAPPAEEPPPCADGNWFSAEPEDRPEDRPGSGPPAGDPPDDPAPF